MLDTILVKARSHADFHDRAVPEDLLRQAHDLMKWGPTTANSQPARILYLYSKESREKLRPALGPVNVEKTMKAPLVAIVAYDTRFYEEFRKLNPRIDSQRYAQRPPEQIREEAFRNGSLEAGYFIMAARALGLDCGPMGGFSRDKVDAEFFGDGRWKSNFLCNLGYGDGQGMKPRAARLSFDEACRIA